MIRVILQGRTGNNLFQYAAGRALAAQHQTELVLDGSWMNQAHADTFEHLLRLPILARYERRHTLVKRLGRKILGCNPESLHRGKVITDPADGTFPDLQHAPDGTLLVGFFQSPLHFAGIENELRSELDLSLIQLPPDSARFEETLRSLPTVSIHVRRGDYLHIGETQCLGEDYHERAIEWFRQRFEGIRFCVFSDEIAWCRTRFHGPEFLFADFPVAAGDPFHDLRLMSSCHHHIIVNSSYSWWGAWLNPSTRKEVIAPKMWMHDLSSENIVSRAWHVL